MTDIDLIKQALEFLEDNQHHIADNERHAYVMLYNDVITTLKERLAQEKALQILHDENERLGLYRDAYAEQEHMKPTAWYDPSNGVVSTDKDCSLFTPLGQVWPLYPKHEWVGLTDKEIKHIYSSHGGQSYTRGIWNFARHVETELKEKNT
jgi:hypothetical protein